MATTKGSQLKFGCGDVVARQDDERHEGEVVAAFDWTVRVKWKASGWKEDVDPDELVLVERRRRSKSESAPKKPTRPRTLVPSARRQLEEWQYQKWCEANGVNHDDD